MTPSFLMLNALMVMIGQVPERDCRGCHLRMSPLQVKHYERSAHAAQGMTCEICHGSEIESVHRGDRTVDAMVCGRCHKKALVQHQRSKHGVGLRAGQACTRKKARAQRIDGDCLRCHEPDTARPRQQVECSRFLTQSSAMQRQGCLACHKIEQRCDSCHGSHDTRLKVARRAETCGRCHMGPDHAQLEMWQTSRHGVLYGLDGEQTAPSCVTCHMPAGSHDVSQGISMGLAGQPYKKKRAHRQREKMLKICQSCHAPGFVRRQLEDGDRVQAESKTIVDQARSIVARLARDGLLQPSPKTRPAHPLSGQKVELGSQMLYEDLSRAEAIFFRMKKFYYVTAYKGVFHQNPDYAHWYGNAPLKLAMSELRSEAALLRRMAELKAQTRPERLSQDALERSLHKLRRQHQQGLINDEVYRRRQGEVLQKFGL